MLKCMKKLNVLITGGPTREYIDDIRFITNPSSGKMGVALCKEALRRKFNVTFIYGPGTAKLSRKVKLIRVETTEEMLKAVVSELEKRKYDIFISSAAVLDYKPKKKRGKIRSGLKNLTIELKPLPKVIDAARKVDKKLFIVGFKAECKVSNRELVKKAYERLLKGKMNLIVANDVGRKNVGFGADTNEVFIIDKEKNVIWVPLTSKLKVAKKIFDVIIQKIKK
jgi:phosphopantothenoylcysteine decarboxylase/phosphopantothenate--cysteine ligase